MPKIWSRIQMSSRNKDNPRIGQQQAILRQCSDSASGTSDARLMELAKTYEEAAKASDGSRNSADKS
jgi:hypothetical protein